MSEDHRANVEAWVNQQDWPRIGCTVIVGWLPEAVDLICAVSPLLEVFVFDPDGRAEKGEGFTVYTHLDDLKTGVQSRHWTHLRINIICPPEYQSWIRSVTNAVEAGRHLSEVFHLTNSHNSKRWTDYGLEMVPRLHGLVPITEMSGVADGCAGVIVASGPSLDAAIPMLQELQGRVIIAACETATPALEAAGIQPDFVCAVEAHPNAYKQVGGLKLWNKTILALGTHTHPEAWDIPAARIMPVLQPVGGVGKWLHRNLNFPAIISGGSVSTICYEVLRLVGCNTIIATGLDCGYGPPDQRKAYADGIDVDSRDLEEMDTIVDGWQGSKVLSHPLLITYRDWFADRPRLNPDVEHINASVGGATIEGWTEMKLGPIAVEDSITKPDMLELAAQGESIDLSWAADDLSAHLDETYNVEKRAYNMLAAQVDALEAIPPLMELGEDPKSEIVRGRGVVPLKEWQWLPTPQNIRAAIANTDRIVRNSREIRPLLERAISALRGLHARAA